MKGSTVTVFSQYRRTYARLRAEQYSRQELPRIKAAAARFPNYKPKITFVVCAKRVSNQGQPDSA